MSEMYLNIGAAVLSLVVVISIYAIYLYQRRHISLASDSEMDHAIAARFDSATEIGNYHAQIDAETHAKANAVLARYRQQFQKARNRMDPSIAAKYPTPAKQLAELI